MKKHALSAMLSIITCVLVAQSETESTKNKLRFGFNFGANYSLLQSNEELPTYSKIYNGVGAKVGLLMDYSISKNLLFSPKTEIVFNKSGVKTTNANNSISDYEVLPISLNIMTHFVYKIGKGSTVPYLLIGPSLNLSLKRAKLQTDFQSKSNFTIDFGIGLENTFQHFIFAPEIRYSLGLLNINSNPIIKSLNYHSISIVLNFKN